MKKERLEESSFHIRSFCRLWLKAKAFLRRQKMSCASNPSLSKSISYYMSFYLIQKVLSAIAFPYVMFPFCESVGYVHPENASVEVVLS